MDKRQLRRRLQAEGKFFCVESQMDFIWGELEQKISNLEELPSVPLG